MDETPIQSRQNKWIKRVRRAIDRHDEEIVLEGPKMVDDAIARGWAPVVVLERPMGQEKRPDSILVEPALFREISATRTPQGVIGLFPRPESSFDDLLEIRPHRIVALDNVQDPGNVGTIVRLCAAFDVCGVVRLPGTADPWSGKVIRSSAGSVLTVPVIESTIDGLIAFALDRGFSIFTADAKATGSSIPPSSNIVLVLGSEGQGPSERWQRISHGVRIETADRVESLNVAAAAAVLLSRLYSG